MSSLDELWSWVATPLRELTEQRAGNPDQSWDELRDFFVRQAGLSQPSDHPLVEETVRQLDDLSEDDRTRLLADPDRLNALVYGIAQEHADAPEADAAAEPAAYDEGGWQQFLVTNGAQWAGDEASWPGFRDWLSYYANEGGFEQPATALLTYLDGQPAPERIATFAQYGVTIQPPVPAEAAEEQAAPQAGQGAGQPEEQPVRLSEDDVQTLLGSHPEFDDIPEDRRRELIDQVLAGMNQ